MPSGGHDRFVRGVYHFAGDDADRSCPARQPFKILTGWAQAISRPLPGWRATLVVRRARRRDRRPMALHVDVNGRW
jgi:hypothetical protein